jgi:hypothetical protein
MPSHIRVIHGFVPNHLSRETPMNRPMNDAATIDIPMLDKKPRDLMS